MSEPLSEQALQVIVARITGITIANGYHTDLGLGLISTEPTQVPETDVAYTLVTDTEETVESANSGPRTTASTLAITIEVIVPVTPDNPNPTLIARRARADIARVLRTDARGMPEGIRAIELAGSQKLIFDDERFSNSVVAQVSARARLSETKPPAAT